MKSVTRALTVSICLFFISGVASAELIMGIDIDFVTIGNPGNPGDTRAAASPSGCGAVGYEYRIGKYEVTNAQWDAFVSAAGAPTGTPSSAYDESASWTDPNVPTDYVSWYEILQFCNYLTSGDKSLGVYQFSGDNDDPGDFTGIDRAAAEATYGTIYFLPTEDEWYKAAYYTGSGYSTYANGTDVAPTAGVDTNYDNAGGQPWDVGTGAEEQNGTFDMMGNVSEWNETLLYGSFRGVRGGTYYDNASSLSSSTWGVSGPADEYSGVGFRIASSGSIITIIPEPATIALLGFGSITLIRRKTRTQCNVM